MSEAISATYDARHAGIRDLTVQTGVIRSIRDPKADRQVREDKPYYVPDAEPNDDNREGRDAAEKHARHLRKAERDVGDALNLVTLAASAIAEDGDDRAMQIGAGLEAAERRLSKALDRLDRHADRHRNLFLAYVDLKEKLDVNEE